MAQQQWPGGAYTFPPIHITTMRWPVLALVPPLLFLPLSSAQPAPTETYLVRFSVGGLGTAGSQSGGGSSHFDVDIHPEWAPAGAARLFDLVQADFFDQARFFRVIPGFMAQFGLPATPMKPGAWPNLQDEQARVKNTAGRISFAKTNAPNSRCEHVDLRRLGITVSEFVSVCRYSL